MPRSFQQSAVCFLLATVLASVSVLAIHSAGAFNDSGAAAATPAPGDDVGLELVFEIRRASNHDLDQTSLIELRTILRQQLALLDVSGQVIRHRDGRILVRINATSDPDGITRVLTSRPVLEIVDTMGETLLPGTTVRTSLSPDFAVATPQSGTAADALGPVFLTLVSGEDLSEVSLVDDPATGQPVIAFTLESDATRRFSDYTSAHIGEPMAILLDKRVISAPTIVAPIAGEGIIAGVPTEDVQLLATQLQIGVLGAPLELVEERVVPATTAAATQVAS